MSDNRRLILRIIDMAGIIMALQISSVFMLPPYLTIFSDYTGASTFTLVIFFLSFYMLDCYNLGQEELRDSLLRVVMAVVIGIIGAGFTFYSFEHWRFPKTMFLLQMAITLVFSIGWRLLYSYLGLQHSQPKRVIFVGVDRAGRARKVLAKYLPQAEVVGYLGNEGADPDVVGPCLGIQQDAVRIAQEREVTRLLILDEHLDPETARDLFNAKLQGLEVDDIRSLYERVARRVPVDLIHENWLLMEDGFNLNVHSYMRRAKRAFDIAFACGMFVVALPVMLLAALAVRIESPGPVIYRQRRVGLHEKEFTVYKIRSMRVDAEKDGAVWASKNDPRVTKVGTFIRKTRIDELPQLWNVLIGDMSVVGPRPERMEFVRELAEQIPFFYVRHTVKPGITGWAQVCYPYGSSVEDARFKLEYDLYYIKHMSAILEAKVVLKTIGVVLFPKGAR